MFPQTRPSLARVALVGAVLAGFVLALVLAACPELHERLHHDADEHEQHECLATVLHAGGCDDPAPVPTFVSFLGELFVAVTEDGSRTVSSLFLSCGILEHAPPRRA